MDKRRRLQVDINQESLNVLEDWASEIRKESDDRRIGSGSIAARLLESLSTHPDMIEKLLAEYTKKAGVIAKDFHEDEEGKRPFAARKR